MNIRRVITVATFTFGIWRAYNNVRKGARRSLIRVAKSI